MKNKRKIFLITLLVLIVASVICLFNIDGFGSEPEFYSMYNRYEQIIFVNNFESFDKYISSGVCSTEPPVTVYNRQNQSKSVFVNELQVTLDSQEWFTEPSVLMYAADGREQYFLQSQAPAQATVGWHYTYEEAHPKPKAVFTYSVYSKSNLTPEQLNQALANTYLAGCGQDFYDMEQNYNINALFAIGVSGCESSYGKHQANKNNFWGRKASSSKWMSFPTKRDSILSFGEYMNKSMYYGKSIENINKIYCPGDGGYWSSSVKKCMKSSWNKIAF